MRKNHNPQMTIFEVLGKHLGAKELEQIAGILDASPEILDQAYTDLVKNRRVLPVQAGSFCTDTVLDVRLFGWNLIR